MKFLAQALFEPLEIGCTILQRNLQHALMRSAGPQENRVDRIRRRLDANVAERDVDVIGACCVADDIEDVATELLGLFELRSRGCAEAKLKRLDAAWRKDLAAER